LDVNRIAYHLEDVFSVGLITVAIGQSNGSVVVGSESYRTFRVVHFQLFVQSFPQLVERQVLLNLAPNCFDFIHHSPVLDYQNEGVTFPASLRRLR
jgi:hypothetical protein